MEAQGVVLVLSGPSGAGKDTLTDLIIAKSDFVRFPTYTTRSPRLGEIDGVHYHFVENIAFDLLWKDGKLLGCAGVHDHYGLHIDELKTSLEKGKCMIMHLVPDSAIALKKLIPQAVVVLVLPPTPEESLRRLKNRGTTEEATIRRMENDQTKNYADFDYDLVVVNEIGCAERVAEKILAFLRMNDF